MHGRFKKTKRPNTRLATNRRVQTKINIRTKIDPFLLSYEMFCYDREIRALRKNVSSLQQRVNCYRNELGKINEAHIISRRQIKLDSDFKYVLKKKWPDIYWQIVDILNKSKITGKPIEFEPERRSTFIRRMLDEMNR
jgi:hypothetical protein